MGEVSVKHDNTILQKKESKQYENKKKGVQKQSSCIEKRAGRVTKKGKKVVYKREMEIAQKEGVKQSRKRRK